MAVGMIDTSFDMYSDTPPGRDPDRDSPTLLRYHAILWSKPLPDGRPIRFTPEPGRGCLRHASPLGTFVLTSDSLGHTYRHVARCADVIARVPQGELDAFFRLCSTIGAYIVFPGNKIDGKPTINGARGMHPRIGDRFDLTLECIRLHYLGQDSPLRDVLARYGDFFSLFGDFPGYARFFLLDDLLTDPGESVRFFLPHDGFRSSPFPSNLDSYRAYRDALTRFVAARNRRMTLEYGAGGRAALSFRSAPPSCP